MNDGVGRARGVLRPAPVAGVFQHARIAPAAALAAVVQHYWSVHWDLQGGPPQLRETLPHPNVHLVLDAGGARIHGIHTGRFSTMLAGCGGVFGVKFRPGGFHALLRQPVSTLRNRSIPAQQVFGTAAAALHAILQAQPDHAFQPGRPRTTLSCGSGQQAQAGIARRFGTVLMDRRSILRDHDREVAAALRKLAKP